MGCCPWIDALEAGLDLGVADGTVRLLLQSTMDYKLNHTRPKQA